MNIFKARDVDKQITFKQYSIYTKASKTNFVNPNPSGRRISLVKTL